jgi:hypothetical protein
MNRRSMEAIEANSIPTITEIQVERYLTTFSRAITRLDSQSVHNLALGELAYYAAAMLPAL